MHGCPGRIWASFKPAHRSNQGGGKRGPYSPSKFSEEKWPLAFELLNNCGGENHEGFIGVQDHGDDVWYRNIRVKVLD